MTMSLPLHQGSGGQLEFDGAALPACLTPFAVERRPVGIILDMGLDIGGDIRTAWKGVLQSLRSITDGPQASAIDQALRLMDTLHTVPMVFELDRSSGLLRNTPWSKCYGAWHPGIVQSAKGLTMQLAFVDEGGQWSSGTVRHLTFGSASPLETIRGFRQIIQDAADADPSKGENSTHFSRAYHSHGRPRLSESRMLDWSTPSDSIWAMSIVTMRRSLERVYRMLGTSFEDVDRASYYREGIWGANDLHLQLATVLGQCSPNTRHFLNVIANSVLPTQSSPVRADGEILPWIRARVVHRYGDSEVPKALSAVRELASVVPFRPDGKRCAFNAYDLAVACNFAKPPGPFAHVTVKSMGLPFVPEPQAVLSQPRARNRL